MKQKWVVFLVVFSLFVQSAAPAFAQSSKQAIIQSQNECSDDLFEKFKLAYVEVTGNELDIDDHVRNEFITHMAIPESEKYNEYAMYSVASLVYALAEYGAIKLHKTYDFKISNATEAAEWRVASRNFENFLRQTDASMSTVQNKINALKVADDPVVKLKPLNDELEALQKDYANVQKNKMTMDELLKKYDTKPRAVRLRSLGWFWGMAAIQGLLLASYIVWLHEIGHSFEGKGNGSPIGYKDLQESDSTEEFQRLLSGMDAQVIQKLYRTCIKSLEINMADWIRTIINSGETDIEFGKLTLKTVSEN